MKRIWIIFFFLTLLFTGPANLYAQEQPLPKPYDTPQVKKIIKAEDGPNDTIFVKAMVIDGEVIGGKELSEVFIWGGNPKDASKYWAEWTRLRNAVYITYPYAKTAGVVMRDVNKHLEDIKGKKERKAYIKSREKDLRSAFTDKVTDLSVYQGIVLMKLINRETGNNCYEIVKEMKGGFTARFYQTLMFFVGSDLKQNWNPAEEKRDRQIESIVQELERMYYGSTATSYNSASR
jgi:hypothetical protein